MAHIICEIFMVLYFRTVTRYNIPVEKQTSLGTNLLKQLVKVKFDVTNTNAFICNNSEGMNIMIPTYLNS